MSFHQFDAACAGQFWFWAGLVMAGVLGFILGEKGAESRSADRIRELEGENQTLREGQDEFPELDEYGPE